MKPPFPCREGLLGGLGFRGLDVSNNTFQTTSKDRYHENVKNVLYLAVRDEVYADIFDEPIAKLLIEDYKIHIVVFQLEQEVIFRWIPWSSTGN
ncbi:element excision factor XisH family protein [Nostoc sp. CHAB 5715]|uniref:element excision factor XisH family protein n=1 Tax=Nostoc sp. CHAB 5715 TaxID=2780400 RepID=UPI001E40E446|nr:element excision factor XisH family protein [Nostoc sp. CHAB 5715]MCC5621331.1 hypothetical protein [Nostoc sp. CHAB 5715]